MKRLDLERFSFTVSNNSTLDFTGGSPCARVAMLANVSIHLAFSLTILAFCLLTNCPLALTLIYPFHSFRIGLDNLLLV